MFKSTIVSIGRNKLKARLPGYLEQLVSQNMLKMSSSKKFYSNIPCFTFWGSCAITEITNLQKLRNRAAMAITDSCFDASSTQLVQNLSWKTVQEVIRYETRTMMYKSINNPTWALLQSFTMAGEMFTWDSQGARRQQRLNANTDFR